MCVCLVLYVHVHPHCYLHIYIEWDRVCVCVCVCVCVIMYIWCECAGSGGGGGCVSWGPLWNVSARPRLRAHEMGKHEIKVEKTHKGVEGGWLGSGWGVGREGRRVACPCTPGPRKAPGPHSAMKRALMRTWLFCLHRIKIPNPRRCQPGASMSYFISLSLSEREHQLQLCFQSFQSHDTLLIHVQHLKLYFLSPRSACPLSWINIFLMFN